MKKLSFPLLFISSLLLIGCGGGGSGNANSGGTGTGTGSVFKYPSFFNEYNTFKTAAEFRRSVFSLPIARADLLVFQNALGSAGITDLGIRTSLQLIDTFPSHSRASCEKGSLSITSYSDAPPSGVFEMSNFSGVGFNISGNEDCPTDYYDGYIKYSVSSQITTATFGKYSSSIGTPYFSGSGGQFNGSTGVLGSVKLEKPNHESVIFTTGVNKSLETFLVQSNSSLNDYTKGPYTKFNSVLLRNATLSKNVNSRTTTFNANYIREWEDEGQIFILFTRISNIVSNINTGEISSGYVEYELIAKGNSDKYVNADITYGSDVKVTYTKEGVTNKNY